MHVCTEKLFKINVIEPTTIQGNGALIVLILTCVKSQLPMRGVPMEKIGTADKAWHGMAWHVMAVQGMAIL